MQVGKHRREGKGGGNTKKQMIAWRIAILLLVAVGLVFSPTPDQASTACRPTTVAIDTSLGQFYVACFLGKAVGQSFVARDTLIRSISVWRGEPGGEAFQGPPMKLWITRTDSTGRPYNVDGVLLDGPIVRAPSDSGPPRPIKVEYLFDPPFALPSPGVYAFFVQDPCLLVFGVLADTSRNVYPEGQFWRTGRERCFLNSPFHWHDEYDWDLIFEIEFCQDATTPVKRRTWGELKKIYR